jgi:dTDP-4-dehydrorhamnose reductase
MILVTGAGGMVGSYLTKVFPKKNLFLTDAADLDVADHKKVFGLVEKVRPEIILHLAAETDVDRCEAEPEHAYKVNTLGTLYLALACQKIDATMIYLSSAMVFDGEKSEPYTEFDQPNPINIYGKTKLEGERAIQSNLFKYFIIRAGWMIGGGKKRDKKFVAKIIEQIRSGKKELAAVNDKFGTPTYALDLLFGIKKLIKTKLYGLYHMGNEGFCSRYDIARQIVQILGKKIEVKPTSSTFFPLPANRPDMEAIRNYKLELTGLVKMRNWRSALKAYLKEF